MPNPARKSVRLPLEERIRDDGFAREAFERLVERGAEQSELWLCLGSLESSQLLGFATWPSCSRLSKREARALAARLDADADKVRAFFTDDLYWYLTEESEFHWIKLMQRNLKRMAGLIRGIRETRDDRGADDARFAKVRLTEYVRTATGRPHDREVAELIRVALCLKSYTPEKHRKFRTSSTKTGHI